ncbi:MAG: 50S ribosomal protein L11 methyltransferase [Deltaproteobacteria bacterium]|nr:MAG: 50S ribosomal protein L11 methyltransferase [Deltaproteobacteria bacterium]
MRTKRVLRLGCVLSITVLAAPLAQSANGKRTFRSDHLEADVVVLPTVFFPNEAEVAVLPFMKENAARFEGKTVLEIGTGSGIISLYAARLGARKVVATDINEQAVMNATLNARRLDLGDIIEARRVPASDITAFSVIRPDERFDVLISNPPYALDLDAKQNTPLTDRGDLGLSIVRGLDAHLNPGGVAILLYNSLFYHYVMVKFAKYEGFEVRNHGPAFFAPWEAETLFNDYLGHLLASEKMDPDAFRFDRHENEALDRIRVSSPHAPLFPGNSKKRYPGIIVIERSADAAARGTAGAP